MKIKILTKKHNPLLKRREISFEVDHDDEGNTPSRLELQNNLANMLKTKSDLLYVKKLQTRTGTTIATGEAHAYESPNQAILVEPEHIVTRNTKKAVENVDEPKTKEKQKENNESKDKSSARVLDVTAEESEEEHSSPFEPREKDQEEDHNE